MGKLKHRMATIEMSLGRHLCPTCLHFEDDIDTTTDPNDCPLFLESEKTGIRWLDSEDTNDRIYYSGLVTKDNGMGYWVTRCPMYDHDFEMCVLMGIEEGR